MHSLLLCIFLYRAEPLQLMLISVLASSKQYSAHALAAGPYWWPFTEVIAAAMLPSSEAADPPHRAQLILSVASYKTLGIHALLGGSRLVCHLPPLHGLRQKMRRGIQHVEVRNDSAGYPTQGDWAAWELHHARHEKVMAALPGQINTLFPSGTPSQRYRF